MIIVDQNQRNFEDEEESETDQNDIRNKTENEIINRENRQGFPSHLNSTEAHLGNEKQFSNLRRENSKISSDGIIIYFNNISVFT